MTVAIEIRNKKKQTIEKKIHNFPNVCSQLVYIKGKYHHDSISHLELTFTCRNCSCVCVDVVEFKRILLWDKESKSFSNYTEVEVATEDGECVKCDSGWFQGYTSDDLAEDLARLPNREIQEFWEDQLSEVFAQSERLGETLRL